MLLRLLTSPARCPYGPIYPPYSRGNCEGWSPVLQKRDGGVEFRAEASRTPGTSPTKPSRPGRLMAVTACQDRHETPRTARTAATARTAPGASSREQSHRQADDVRDAALQAFDQARAQGLDRVAAAAAFPLAEVDVALLLGLGDALEDDLGAFEAGALLARSRRGRPGRSSRCGRVPTCGRGSGGRRRRRRACRGPRRRGRRRCRRRSPCAPAGRSMARALRRAFSITRNSGSPESSSSTPGTTTSNSRPSLARISRRWGEPEARTTRGTRCRSRARPTRRNRSRGPC